MFYIKSFHLKTRIIQRSFATLVAIGSAQFSTAEGINEIVVLSDFRDTRLLELPNSVTVIDQNTITQRGAQHLEQLLNLAPNVNFSSGASRGRFFQIRGIGERSQFIDPVNPSVGLIIDGIDFTGLGLSASTLDIAQVEILRGPQGTLYGANALAGLVYLKSNDPTDQLTGNIGVELAEFDGRVINAVLSGPITDRISYRIAAQRQDSDGFTDNDFLNRDNTNNIEEKAIRGKLSFQVSEDLLINLSGFYLDADNGYDDFSLSNNRVTTSDQPGHDKQKSVAAGLNLLWSGHEAFDVEGVISAIDADTRYGFDEDWSYLGEFDDALFPYSSADDYVRNRENLSVDIRLVSKEGQEIFEGTTSWVAGMYFRSEEEELSRTRFDDLNIDVQFDNSFETEHYAAYGQLSTVLSDKFTLITGLRVERRDADYSDSAGVIRDPSDDLWGGRISLEYQLSDDVLLYGLAARGYKAGGVNGQIISVATGNPNITESFFDFDKETQWNYELGMKGSWLESRLQAQFALFYQDRSDVQAGQSIFNPADFSFDEYLTNADGGVSLGLEAEFSYQATGALDLYGSIGFLNAEFEDFIAQSHVDARDDFTGLPLAPVNLDGRDIAHAPNYQFLVGSEFRFLEHFYMRVEIEGKDEFFFSNSHDEKSDSYELFNARLGYRLDEWEVALWGRNLTDEDVAVRGFFFSNQFGNNPGNGYAPEVYQQLGEPRVIGLSASYRFE